jgi:hypothetical protein
MSNIQSSMSNIQSSMSNIQSSMSNIQSSMSDIQYSMSHMQSLWGLLLLHYFIIPPRKRSHNTIWYERARVTCLFLACSMLLAIRACQPRRRITVCYEHFNECVMKHYNECVMKHYNECVMEHGETGMRIQSRSQHASKTRMSASIGALVSRLVPASMAYNACSTHQWQPGSQVYSF